MLSSESSPSSKYSQTTRDRKRVNLNLISSMMSLLLIYLRLSLISNSLGFGYILDILLTLS
jgi:hypothetical protein